MLCSSSVEATVCPSTWVISASTNINSMIRSSTSFRWSEGAGNSVVFLLYDDLYIYYVSPTCQVIEFIKVACLLPILLPPPFPPASSILLPCQPRAPESSVGTTGHQLQAAHLSGHCRTSTASLNCRLQTSCRASTPNPRSQVGTCPDLNSKLQISAAGPQLRAARSQWALPKKPQPRAPNLSGLP